MQSVAQAWLVLQLTESALALGTISALQFMPVLVFGLWGGVIADRVPKRLLLLYTQSASLLLAIILGVLVVFHWITIWQVGVLAALLGTVNAIDMPTRQAFVVDMVGKDDLPNAIALNSSLFNSARMIGPAIAGIMISMFGVQPLFFLNAASFLAVIIALTMMDLPIHRASSSIGRPSAASQIGEGLRFIRATPSLMLTFGILTVVSVFAINFNVFIPLLARSALHAGPTGYGFLMAALGLGSLAAALTVAARGRNPQLWRAVLSMVGLGAMEIAVGASHVLAISLVLLVGVGFAAITFTTTTNTLVQTQTPDALRGRVMSVYTTIFVGSNPLGSLIVGLVANRWGVGASLIDCGGVCLLSGLVLVFSGRVGLFAQS